MAPRIGNLNKFDEMSQLRDDLCQFDRGNYGAGTSIFRGLANLRLLIFYDLLPIWHPAGPPAWNVTVYHATQRWLARSRSSLSIIIAWIRKGPRARFNTTAC